MADELDPPPQLPVEVELDRVTVRVRGVVRSRTRDLLDLAWEHRGMVIVFAWGMVSLVRVFDSLVFFVPAIGAVAMVGAAGVNSERGASTTLVRWDARSLHVEVGGSPVQVPLLEVGRVAVIGDRAPVLRVRRLGTEPLLIPMENEPVEHAVWLADAIEAAARASRGRLGHAGEVPRALSALRRDRA